MFGILREDAIDTIKDDVFPNDNLKADVMSQIRKGGNVTITELHLTEDSHTGIAQVLIKFNIGKLGEPVPVSYPLPLTAFSEIHG